MPLKDDVIIILVSDPVDVLTMIVQRWCDGHIPLEQIIGSSTCIDSQKITLSKDVNVSVRNITKTYGRSALQPVLDFYTTNEITQRKGVTSHAIA